MKDRVSSNYRKIITFVVIFTLSTVVLTPLPSNTVSANDDVGVGILPVRPRITDIELEHNMGSQHLRFVVFDLNSWHHVSRVSVEFYQGEDELVRHYVFNQTKDLDRSIEVRKGDGLIDFESHSSEKRKTVDQRCNLTLHFQFSGISYDRITIRAQDHAGGTSESTIQFQGVTTGLPMTFWLLPFIVLATAAIMYKTVKSVGGEIDVE